jgi:hypothetical protein
MRMRGGNLEGITGFFKTLGNNIENATQELGNNIEKIKDKMIIEINKVLTEFKDNEIYKNLMMKTKKFLINGLSLLQGMLKVNVKQKKNVILKTK